ncbi:MAG: PD-(D/E)XK nuclease family protein [Christensenellaceae bacterium]|jgi:ATP-dependent helicase/DNAse subunit B|nr:PD-(D/E)XK nuclease family protein [Christensenellaceae bacterium]
MKFVLQCNNVYAEAGCLANRICELVAGGARYRDITVVVCDYQDTAPIYTQVFADSGIPVNADVGGDLMAHPTAKHLRDVMLGAPWRKDAPTFRGRTALEICRELNQILDGDDVATERIRGILTVIGNVLGEQSITLGEFNNMFCTLCTACKISDVPKYLDRVMLVDVKEYEPSFVPHLFIAGATAEAFPQGISDTDIITEQDISEMKIKIEPSARLQAARSLQHARNIINSATKDVFVSYSSKNSRGSRGAVSPLAGSDFKTPDAKFFSKMYAKQRTLATIGNKSAFVNNEQAEFFASVAQATDLGELKIPQICKQPNDITDAEKLFFKKGHISVTTLENFAKCPYYSFLVNGLGLKKREPQNQIAPSTVGTILHAFAETFLKTGKTADTIIKDVLKDYRLPKHITSVITVQAHQIADYLALQKDLDFVPRFFEYSVEGVIGGKTVCGKVDRIDVGKNNTQFTVVDYKTGDPGAVRLQLPIYMWFLQSRLNMQPNGGYYLNLRKFTKKAVDTDEISTAVTSAKASIESIKNGQIRKQPINKSVCEYCPCGAMCGVGNG